MFQFIKLISTTNSEELFWSDTWSGYSHSSYLHPDKIYAYSSKMFC